MAADLRNSLAISGLLVALTVLVALDEWGVAVAGRVSPFVTVAALALLARHVGWSRRAFVATGLALTLLLAASAPDWQGTVMQGLNSAAFIGAFFTALSTLRNVAESSPAIRAGGTFLAARPPGRRHIALRSNGAYRDFAVVMAGESAATVGAGRSDGRHHEPHLS